MSNIIDRSSSKIDEMKQRGLLFQWKLVERKEKRKKEKRKKKK